MLKKILILSTAVVVGGFVLFGTSAWRHVSHGVHRARQALDDSVPIQFQLEQAESMIEDIIPEIEASKQVVAEEQVEIRYLTSEIHRLSSQQMEEESRIKAKTASLSATPASVSIAGRPYSKVTMENEIRLALKKHQNTSSLVESKRRLLEARERSLEAARQKLNAVIGEKENVEIAVEQLKARLREAEALEASGSRFILDDGKLAQVQGILARCKKRLDVAQQLIENEHGSLLTDPVASDAQGDVTEEVSRYFGQPAVATVSPLTR